MGELHAFVHFLTQSKLIVVQENDVDCHYYKLKSGEEPRYALERSFYFESQGLSTYLSNKRPNKLKERLKELEDVIGQIRVVHLKWIGHHAIQVLLANGMHGIVQFNAAFDIDQVVLDKSLSDRITGAISGVAAGDTYAALTYTDLARLDLFFWKSSGDKMWGKEGRMESVELPASGHRRLVRRLVASAKGDLMLVWWTNSAREAQPWVPVMSEKESANMLAVVVSSGKARLASVARSIGELHLVYFGRQADSEVFSVETRTNSRGESLVEDCLWLFNEKGQLLRDQLKSISIIIPAPLNAASVSDNQELLGLCCEDRSLVLFNRLTQATQTIRLGFVASTIVWHPDSVLAIATSSTGDLQCFDRGGNLWAVSGSRLSDYHRLQPVMGLASWCDLIPPAGTAMSESVALFFERGPIVLIHLSIGADYISHEFRFTEVLLVNELLRRKQYQGAVNILTSLQWDSHGDICLSCLTKIMDSLLFPPLNLSKENLLQVSLGTFYSPPVPLRESTIVQYRDQVSRYARRFFFLLLRHCRFEKAYLLTVDLAMKDLFMDLYFMAIKHGEKQLAEAARRRASEIELEGDLSSESECSEDESEESNDQQHASDDDADVPCSPPPPPPKGKQAAKKVGFSALF